MIEWDGYLDYLDAWISGVWRGGGSEVGFQDDELPPALHFPCRNDHLSELLCCM